jgi:predicted TPR repeat methyltransferase
MHGPPLSLLAGKSPSTHIAMDATLDQARSSFFDGIAHFEAGRLDEARQSFEASLALAPGRPSVLLNLGLTLFRLGRWQDAIAPLQAAATAEPGQADVWTHLGLTHEALGHWAEAATSFEHALGLAPQQAPLWLAYGRCQLRLGQADRALESFQRAVEVAPDSAEAWSERGSLLRELHRLDEAASCFEKAIALGADDDLHRYYLASVRGTGAPAAPPRRYVEALFDDYAGDFQDHLVGRLRYQGHETLLRPLVDAGRRYPSVLDLGCGSGLCGPLIRPLADAVDGVDISAAMLDKARRLGVYRDLVHADLATFLAGTDRKVDLVLAADVFIYVGELSATFRSIRRLLNPGGCLAFTVELPPGNEDMCLLPSLRYAHSESHVRKQALAHGFSVRDIFAAPLRYDQSQPVRGLYVYLE